MAFFENLAIYENLTIFYILAKLDIPTKTVLKVSESSLLEHRTSKNYFWILVPYRIFRFWKPSTKL